VVLDQRTSKYREQIILDLKGRGVGTSVHYPVPIPLSKYYQKKYGAEARDFPNALRISTCSIALPVGPHLDVEDMRVIASELKAAIARTRS
jgi:dTDP-4-amino-4,6-dideoxygalactose transaminase